jgi:hypothetical protein
MNTEPVISEGARDNATAAIDYERERQVNDENWSEEHDDQHQDGSLWRAAHFYATTATKTPIWGYMNFKQWPWGPEFFKPWKKNGFGNYTTEIDAERCLIKAGALILAEQDRLDRALQKVINKLAEVQSQRAEAPPAPQ